MPQLLWCLGSRAQGGPGFGSLRFIASSKNTGRAIVLFSVVFVSKCVKDT